MSQPERAAPTTFGPYLLLRPIEDTGPRPVYLAAVQGSDRPWVLKKMAGRDAQSDEKKGLVARVRAWGRAASLAVVEVLETEEVDGETVVVMEYVPGVSLQDIQVALGGRRCLPLHIALHIVREVALGLSRLHTFEEAPVAHGNVSPRTTLVFYDGRVKLGCIAPGQVPPQGDAAELVRRDLRMLGELLRWALTGEIAPAERSADRIVGDAAGHPALPRVAISPEADAIVLALLGTGPRTLSSADEVADALVELIPETMSATAIKSFLRPYFDERRLKEKAEAATLVDLAIKTFGTDTRPAASEEDFPSPGETLGKYKIVRAIGHGGMGRVFEAIHQDLNRRVAIKVLNPRHRSPELEERFRREARATQGLPHLNIVEVTDFGTTGSGLPYLVMEYIDGVTLEEAIYGSPEPFPIARALHVARQICDAVAVAHARGVIHRDIKPANIMLLNRAGDADFVKVLDFGLAKLSEATGDVKLTAANQFFGTIDYAAPEQLAGAPATLSVDIYAAGELLYEMLARMRPHTGDTDGEVIARKMGTAPTPIRQHRPDLPEPIAAVVMKALGSRPEDRHATMKDLVGEIETSIALLRSASPIRRDSALMRKRLIAAGALGAAALVATIAWTVGGRHSGADTVRVQGPAAKVLATAPVKPADVMKAPVADLSPTEHPIGETKAPRLPSRPSASRLEHTKLGATSPTHFAPEPGVSGAELVHQAEAAFEDGRRVDAIALAKQAARAGAGTKAHLALAKYYQSMGLPQDAAREYREVLKTDPRNQIALFGLRQTEVPGSGP